MKDEKDTLNYNVIQVFGIIFRRMGIPTPLIYSNYIMNYTFYRACLDILYGTQSRIKQALSEQYIKYMELRT